ncbi:MAG: bile acid:sodium symporter family protein [Opitutales bacterium]|nr:bile acid:sodium symporter family protein [Opitutales bacterium]
MKFLFRLAKILSSKTALFVIAAAVLAFFYPNLFLWVRGDAQAFILGFIMLSMGMTLSAEDFKILLRRPWDIFIGVCVQYTFMPLIAYAMVKFFDLPTGIAIGLLLVGTCPGGVSSNIMSYLANGDVAFSVGMTTASTLISPILTPLLMLVLSGENIEIDAVGMFKSILIVTLFPVIAGAVLNFLFSKKKAYMDAIQIMPAFSVLGLAFIVAGVTALCADKILTSGIAIFLLVALHNGLGYLSGYLMGVILKMGIARRRTLAIEVGCQNAGLGTNLACRHFSAMPEAALATAVACVYHSISGTVLANIFALCDRLRSSRKK